MILVTGATGFIGRHIVSRLALGRGRVAVLARGREGLSPQARVQRVFGALAQNIAVLEGDLADPEKLKRDTARLSSGVDRVVHCAGEPAFDSSEDSARPVHIDGPMALLEALGEKGLRGWSQISTAFVCGRRSGTVYEHETDVGQSFHNAYERLKLEAEISIARACARRGIEWRNFRPGIVIGQAPATKGGTPSNLLGAFLCLLFSLAGARPVNPRVVRIKGCCPDAPFNIVSAEFIARAVERLAEAEEACGKTFHLLPAEPPNQAAMLEMISERLGLRYVRLLKPEEELSNPSVLEERIARLLQPYKGYLAQHVRFDCRHSRALLEAGGVVMPVIDGVEVDRSIAWHRSAGRIREASMPSPRKKIKLAARAGT